MHLLLRTNDLVLLSFVESLLSDAGLEAIVLDAHISAVEGSIGMFPRRVVVADGDASAARRLLAEAGLSAELAPET
jgi:hypothetical protein